jgi:hypothetical protein
MLPSKKAALEEYQEIVGPRPSEEDVLRVMLTGRQLEVVLLRLEGLSLAKIGSKLQNLGNSPTRPVGVCPAIVKSLLWKACRNLRNLDLTGYDRIKHMLEKFYLLPREREKASHEAYLASRDEWLKDIPIYKTPPRPDYRYENLIQSPFKPEFRDISFENGLTLERLCDLARKNSTR